MRKLTGFTLIEILIVMLIISIVGGVAMLSISFNPNTRYKTISREIKNLLMLGEEQALLQANVFGLAFTDKTFQFYQYNSEDKKNPWHPINEAPLGVHNIPAGVQITVKVNDKIVEAAKDPQKLKPQLILSTSGEIIPFTILIGKTDGPPRYQVIGHTNGSLESVAIAD
jgi:general secretion pathway protein H